MKWNPMSLRWSRDMIKPTESHVYPAKTQLSLRSRAVWSESSLGAVWVANYPMLLHADTEDADQTARTRKLIWVFTYVHVIL